MGLTQLPKNPPSAAAQPPESCTELPAGNGLARGHLGVPPLAPRAPRAPRAVSPRRAAPAGAASFSLKHTEAVSVEVEAAGQAEAAPADGGRRWPLGKGTVLRLGMRQASAEAGDNKVRSGAAEARPRRTAAGRSPARAARPQGSWTWGPEGQGAILLVNCDRESPALSLSSLAPASPPDLLDMSRMVLRTEGPPELPRGYQLVLHVAASDADKVGVFYVQSRSRCCHPSLGQRYVHVLGRRKLFHAVRYPGGGAELDFFVEGLRFPDAAFSGLVSIHVSLLETLAEGLPAAPVFTDTVAFRVAPWIMTPNTLPPVTVFVCSVKDNYLFLKEMRKLVDKAGCELKVCYGYMNRGDRWMQDEVEFGYIHAPHKSFPVVLDSPRDGGLKDFPIKELLGPDFGYVTREPQLEAVSSLDSFGNLEVSPPVTVGGKEYPLARGRTCEVVREFLYAQQVQAPVELYSDWLSVGHVDEFVTFVPSADTQGFRMLLASPAACYQLFREKQKEGWGEATMFKGEGAPRRALPKREGVMARHNQYAQRCIDWNRDILKKELGLTESDILDVPALFRMDSEGKAVAFFPNMVNMLVLSAHVGIPKPFGPVLEGECCLERHVRALLEPLGLACSFLDDVSSYHRLLGEVHCGTNVRRRPFRAPWWRGQP
uniref:protein-arginine deiminase n=1 Tax=Nothoprocta perdicaria TaxID=30464 RepID=A0A8C6ZCJ0_NOTPE